MKKISLSLVLLAAMVAVQAQTGNRAGFLWQLKMNESVFYLAGSLHAGKADLYPLPEAYTNAYSEADYVIMEVKEDFDTLQEMIFCYAEKDKLPEEQYLDRFLRQESKDKLVTLFKGEEEKLERYYRYEGWLLNMAIAVMKSKFIGYDPKLSVDRYFHNLATTDRKMILGMDNLETQLKLFEFHVPVENQVRIIEAAITRMEGQARSEQILFDTYYNQDREAFKTAFLASMDLDNPQIKQVYDLVFTNRNKAWVNKLVEISSTQPGTYFMLVGSGHFFGPDNVIDLLERGGFPVTQL